MTRIDELSQEEQKRMARWGVVFVAVLFPIVVITFFWLLADTWAEAMKAGASMFEILRTSLLIIYVLDCLPGAALVELVDSQTKKRSFKPFNILILLLLLGEYFLIIGTFLTFFDMLLGGMSAVVQLPFLTLGMMVPLLPTVATFKIRRFHNFFKKAFE